jgi:hypothetical protein
MSAFVLSVSLPMIINVATDLISTNSYNCCKPRLRQQLLLASHLAVQSLHTIPNISYLLPSLSELPRFSSTARHVRNRLAPVDVPRTTLEEAK